jgi:hypothetical protein
MDHGAEALAAADRQAFRRRAAPVRIRDRREGLPCREEQKAHRHQPEKDPAEGLAHEGAKRRAASTRSPAGAEGGEKRQAPDEAIDETARTEPQARRDLQRWSSQGQAFLPNA